MSADPKNRLDGPRARLAVIAAIFVLLGASPARAQGAPARGGDEPSARARASESFREAKAAFARGDFAAAAAAFEQAARLAPHPATWLNAAEAWERRGDLVHAAEDCDRARDVSGEDESYRREVDARLARVLAAVGTLEAAGPRALSIRVDGGDAQQLPARRRLAPGVHRVVTVDVATGRERAEEVTLRANHVTRFDARAFADAPPAIRVADDRARPGPPAATWICFGLAGAFAVPATIFGVSTLAAKSDYDAAPSRDALDRFKRDRTLTDVSLAAALTALGVGTALWIIAPRRAPPPRAFFAVPSRALVEF